ncbi:MAG: hypothetical protein COS85_19280 [Armatimonadetes bacterium CG07_land_8_20_14_0_80_59_28]|nr:MAG: hypothetical protein COS85_19280 [Armatimonadetes bacterium CG07_land_8_20_14_0_80_59_28]
MKYQGRIQEVNDLKEQLSKYLNDLWQAANGKMKVGGVTYQISTEKDLERHVKIGAEGDTTLLRVLGYTANDIEDHPTLPVEVGRQVLNLEPDYVLLHQRKPTAILELKAPPPRRRSERSEVG